MFHWPIWGIFEKEGYGFFGSLLWFFAAARELRMIEGAFFVLCIDLSILLWHWLHAIFLES